MKREGYKKNNLKSCLKAKKFSPLLAFNFIIHIIYYLIYFIQWSFYYLGMHFIHGIRLLP